MTATDHTDTATGWAPERDLGTPPVAGETVHLTIDGRPVDVAEGTSVMRAAALAGIDVPKLCATDSMKAFGSCRMCLVEVEDGKGVPASCTTPCSDGMVVRTDTEQVQQLRRGVMELYLSDHPTDCDGCARGNCEIQALATRVGAAEVRYGLGRQHVEEDQPTPPTRTSTTTPPPASCAHGACARATTSRARSR